MTAYEEATYYDCGESERYSYETPSEAIEAYLDIWMSPGCDVLAIIVEHSPITVTGYMRDEPAGWVERISAGMAEHASEAWAEEYGDPDGGGFDAKAVAHLVDEIQTALRWVVAQHEVWTCSPCGEQTYQANEVVALVRESHPSWFEEPHAG